MLPKPWPLKLLKVFRRQRFAAPSDRFHDNWVLWASENHLQVNPQRQNRLLSTLAFRCIILDMLTSDCFQSGIAAIRFVKGV